MRSLRRLSYLVDNSLHFPQLVLLPRNLVTTAQPTSHSVTRGDWTFDAGSQIALADNQYARDAHVHGSSVVEPGAILGKGVRVGPHCFIGESATVGDGCILEPGVRIFGRTSVGPGCLVRSGAILGSEDPGETVIGTSNVIGYHAVVGSQCPDLKYRGGPCHLVIGDRNDLREFVQIHRSSSEGAVTRVGSRNLIMGGVHVAHDCSVGDSAVIANGVMLAGHVRVGDRAVIGGGAAVQQRVVVGPLAFVAGGAMVEASVPACLRAKGDRAQLAGLNVEGLRRAGYSRTLIVAALRAVGALYREGPLGEGYASDLALSERARALLATGEFLAAGIPESAQPATFVLQSVAQLAKGDGLGTMRPARWRRIEA